LRHQSIRALTKAVKSNGSSSTEERPLAEFFYGFLQQFSFADPTDSPNTQDWLFGPYVVHPVDPSQSFEEMAQKLPLMVSIGKEF